MKKQQTFSVPEKNILESYNLKLNSENQKFAKKQQTFSVPEKMLKEFHFKPKNKNNEPCNVPERK